MWKRKNFCASASTSLRRLNIHVKKIHCKLYEVWQHFAGATVIQTSGDLTVEVFTMFSVLLQQQII